MRCGPGGGQCLPCRTLESPHVPLGVALPEEVRWCCCIRPGLLSKEGRLPPNRRPLPSNRRRLPPTAVHHPPTAVGCPPTAVRYPPTAVGYPPTAVVYPQPQSVTTQPPPVRPQPPSVTPQPPSFTPNRRRLPPNRRPTVRLNTEGPAGRDPRDVSFGYRPAPDAPRCDIPPPPLPRSPIVRPSTG